jgi:predicted component of type VI protein secretion system
MQVKLKILLGKSAGKEVAIPVPRFLIGRGSDCHMRPKSDAISRNHCAIAIHEGEDKVTIRDLNSRNGTFVNGERISSECELKAGDHIRVGPLEFEAVIKEVKKAPQPKPAEPEKPVVEEEAAAKPASVGIKSDSSVSEFDVSDWLSEADAVAKARRQSEPETRQFQIEETDRIALEAAAEQPEASSEEDKADKAGRPAKKAPGKLPPRPKAAAPSSKEAAADMLKKFFTNR